MVQQFLLLESKQHSVQREKHSTAHMLPSSQKQIEQAWRWKSLLIQTSLLSALNGICYELSTVGRTAHCISKYTIVGVEAVQKHLILQNFTLVASENHAPKYLVRQRCFSANVNDLVELLLCKFSPKDSGRQTPKKIWRTGATNANEQDTVKNVSIVEYELPRTSMSLRFEKGRVNQQGVSDDVYIYTYIYIYIYTSPLLARLLEKTHSAHSIDSAPPVYLQELHQPRPPRCTPGQWSTFIIRNMHLFEQPNHKCMYEPRLSNNQRVRGA